MAERKETPSQGAISCKGKVERIVFSQLRCIIFAAEFFCARRPENDRWAVEQFSKVSQNKTKNLNHR